MYWCFQLVLAIALLNEALSDPDYHKKSHGGGHYGGGHHGGGHHKGGHHKGGHHGGGHHGGYNKCPPKIEYVTKYATKYQEVIFCRFIL